MSDKFIKSVKVVKTTGVADKRPVSKSSNGKVVCNARPITEGLLIRDSASRPANRTKFPAEPIDKK